MCSVDRLSWQEINKTERFVCINILLYFEYFKCKIQKSSQMVEFLVNRILNFCPYLQEIKSSLINSTLFMVQRNYADFMIPKFCLETWRLSFSPVLHPNPNDDHPYQVNPKKLSPKREIRYLRQNVSEREQCRVYTPEPQLPSSCCWCCRSSIICCC